MVRQFSLINKIGETLNLMDRDTFFQNPDGMGVSLSIEAADMGGFFAVSRETITQQNITGEIVFKTYDLYHDFVTRFAQKKEMTFVYTAAVTGYRDVILQSIGKTEKEAGRLICPVDFMPLSPWYRKKEYKFAEASTDVGKIYPYTYPYTYADNEVGDITIDNSTGAADSPCRLTIYGEAINPTWSLIVNGEVVQSGEINATIADGQKLVVDSNPLKMEISLYSISGEYIASLYQNSNFGTQRFIYLPSTQAIMRISHDGTTQIAASVEVTHLNETI